MMEIIVDYDTSMNKEGSDKLIVIQKAAKDMERDIRDFLRYAS